MGVGFDFGQRSLTFAAGADSGDYFGSSSTDKGLHSFFPEAYICVGDNDSIAGEIGGRDGGSK